MARPAPRLRGRPRVPVGRLAITVALLAACRAPEGAQATPRGNEAAIGVAFNPTRPGMQTILRGVELAVDHLNRDRDRKGIRFTIRRAPDSLTGAVQIATALRDDPTIVGVVGHPESGSTLDAASVYADEERAGERAVVAISPTASSPSLTGRSAWIFRICPTDVVASAAAARFAIDSLRARRASIVYRNDSYGRDWTRAFVATYTAAGGTVVQADPYVAGITEWDVYARYVATAAPDVVLFPGSAEDAAPAIRALRRVGVTAPVIGGDAVSSLDADGDEFAGVRYTSFFEAAAATSPEGRAFVSAYRARYGESPDQRAALAYDAAMIIGRGVVEGGANRRRVRDAIASFTGVGPHRGATGAIAFNSQNDVIAKPVAIVTVGRR